jgi:hypothetical protein
MKRSFLVCLIHCASLALVTANGQTLNFGSVSVGTASAGQTVTYNFSSATTLATVDILTAGASGLDYADGGGSTCTAGAAYNANQSCSVTVAFTPSAPGLRSGAVTLFAQGSNQPLTTWYLNGIGLSGAVTIDPGTQSTIATLSGNGRGYGLAVDGAGNVYVVDQANSQVIELAAGSYSPSTLVASGLQSPSAVVLDGAGNLYISDTGNSRVEVVPNEIGGLNAADMSTVSINGLGSPLGLAVDGSGDLYVADGTNGNVIEVMAGSGLSITVVSGLANPNGIAVDAAGNLYVAGNNQVLEYGANGASPIAMGGGYNDPTSVVVDASGAVYVADSGNAQIVRVVAGGASQSTLAIEGLANPQGVAVDAADNVYWTDGSNAYEFNRTQAAALAFGSTNVGSTSAPQTLTVTSAGNQPLAVSTLAISANFAQVPSGGTDCASSTQLPASGQCLIAIALAPTIGGPQIGTLAVSDNALNNPASTQTVQLSGSGSQVSQTLSFPAIPSQTYGIGPVVLGATASSGLSVSYAVISGPATASGGALIITGAGSVTVQASQAGNAQYAPAVPVSQTFLVTQAATSVVWSSPAAITYGTPLTSTQLDATATPLSAGTYVYTPSSGTVLNGGSQLLSVQFTPSNGNYSASSGSVALQVNQASQTITFAAIPTQTYGVGPITLSAAASSGLAVSYAVTSGPATVSANLLTITGVGSVIVQASQVGNTNYAAASPVSQTFTVNQASQSITLTQTAPKSAPYNSSFTVTATASSGLPVSFSAAGVCSNVGGTFTMTNSSGTCTVTVSQSGNANYLAAAKVVEATTAASATPVVTFTGAPASAPYESSFTVAATANSGISATITASGSCSISGATVTITSGTGACSMLAKWAGNNYYLPTSLSQTTTATRLVSTVSWPAPAAITYPTALSGTQLNAIANVAGTFAYSPKTGAVLNAGSQTLTVTFTPTLSQNYTVVTSSVVLQVNQAQPAITWANPAAIAYGTALSGTQLDATASVGGTFSYSPKMGAVLNAGSQTLTATFVPGQSQNYATVTTSVVLQVNAAQSVINWPAPTAITYGTALSTKQLDATVKPVTTGTFVYSPSTGTVVNAGSQNLTVQFTPSSSNYTSASAGVTLQVNQATQTIKFSTIPNQVYGAGPITLNATASSGLPVSYAVTSGPASVSGNILTMTGVGSVTVQASQAGNINYSAAAPVPQTFSIVTGQGQAPSVPTNLRVDIADGNTGQLMITWTQSAVTQTNPAPNNYILQRSISPSSGYSTVTNCSGLANFSNTATPFSSAGGTTYMCRDNNGGLGLIPATTYYYQLQSCIGSSPCSNPTAIVSGTPISCNCTQGSTAAQIPPMIYSTVVSGQTVWQNLVPPALGRVATSVVDPLATYAVTDANGNPISELYAPANPGPVGWPIPAQNKLFVDLPGSGGTCSDSTAIYTAQNLGFDAICVNYSNHTEQDTVCNGDPGCYGMISRAKFDGGGPCGISNSDAVDCGEDPYPGPNAAPYYNGVHDAVYSRILTLLEYLTGNSGTSLCNTSGYWGRYLVAQYQTETGSYCALNWSQMILGGWSQGGDMATYTAGFEAQNGTPIARAINWSAPPQATQVNGTWEAAAYLSGWFPGTTIRSIFGLVSANDFRYSPPGTPGTFQTVWAAMGFTPGPPNYDGELDLNVSGNLQGLNCNVGTPSNNFVNFAPANPYSGDGHNDTLYLWNQDIYEFMLLDN